MQSVGKAMVALVMVVWMGSRLLFDTPPEMEKIVDGAGELEGAIGVVAVDLASFVEKTLEERVVKVGDGNHKSLRRGTIVVF